MKNWWLLFLVVILVFGCREKVVFNELQTTACNAASEHGTCDRLEDLGIVTANDCCFAFGKCCDTTLITGHAVLSDVQATTCESASANNKCDELAELGLVAKEECCSQLNLCCSTVSLEEFESVLINAIKDYFVSETPKLTTAELKDLIVAYLSTPANNVDLSGIGEYSGKKLTGIYDKAKGTITCTPSTCSSLGKECDNWSDGCGNTLNCGTCSTGKTCSNGQCVTTGTTPSITVLWPNAPMGTYRAGETYDIRVLCINNDRSLKSFLINIFLIDERIAPPSRSEIMFNFVTCKNAKDEYGWTVYNWTIPLDISSDDRKFVFRIRAETLDSLIGDESEYSFSIDRPLPRITVLSPNGWETLTIGASYTIKWDSTLRWASTDPSVFSVLRLDVYGADGYYKGTIGDVWDTGSFIWKVGEVTMFWGWKKTLPPGQYKIRIARVIKTEGSPRTYLDILDESDMPFSVAK